MLQVGGRATLFVGQCNIPSTDVKIAGSDPGVKCGYYGFDAINLQYSKNSKCEALAKKNAVDIL